MKTLKKKLDKKHKALVSIVVDDTYYCVCERKYSDTYQVLHVEGFLTGICVHPESEYETIGGASYGMLVFISNKQTPDDIKAKNEKT